MGDLTSPSSTDDEEEVDVVGGILKIEEMDCSQVRDWVRGVEGCAEYADTFYDERIDGSVLVNLNVHHLTGILGLGISQADLLLSKLLIDRGGHRNNRQIY